MTNNVDRVIHRVHDNLLQIIKKELVHPDKFYNLIKAIDSSTWDDEKAEYIEAYIQLKEEDEISFITLLLKCAGVEESILQVIIDSIIILNDYDIYFDAMDEKLYMSVNGYPIYVEEEAIKEILEMEINPIKSNNITDKYNENYLKNKTGKQLEINRASNETKPEIYTAVEYKYMELEMDINSSPKTEKALKEALDIVLERLKLQDARTQLEINKDLARFLSSELSYLPEDDALRKKIVELNGDWGNLSESMKAIKSATKQQPLTQENVAKGQLKTAAIASVGTAVVLLIIKSIDWNKVATFLLRKALMNTNAAEFLTEGAQSGAKQVLEEIEKAAKLSETTGLVDESDPQIKALKEAGVDVNGIAERFLANANMKDILSILQGEEAEEASMQARLQSTAEDGGISVDNG